MVMCEEHNVTKGNVATIPTAYNASTTASVVALVRSCGATEQRMAANFWKTIVPSSLILHKEYFNNRNEYN
jgi:hypothetical protein